MLTPRRRRAESGQVLIAALAMIAFVGVMSVASFHFLDLAFLQHQDTETTAETNMLAEGAARFATNTVANSGAARCSGPASGSLTYAPSTGMSESLSYSVATCIPDYVSTAPGSHCALCILGTDPAALSLNSNAQVMITGEVVINGGVSLGNNSSLCSTSGPNDPVAGVCHGTPEFIGIGGTLPAPTTAFTPAPTRIAPIGDPLSSLPAPALGLPSLPTLGAGVAVPGTYQGLSLGGGQVATLSSGVYVMTQDVKITGSAQIIASGGVTLFFTCESTTAGVRFSHACSSGQSGAALDLSGGGSYQIAAPTSGSYKDIAVFYDRNNIGDLGPNVGLKVNGGSSSDQLSGGIYASAASVDIGGSGGSLFSTNGRLVVATANIHVGASAGAGLNLVGAAPASTCDLYNASVSGSETTGTTTTRTGHVVFVNDPSRNCGGTRIVSFAYTP